MLKSRQGHWRMAEEVVIVWFFTCQKQKARKQRTKEKQTEKERTKRKKQSERGRRQRQREKERTRWQAILTFAKSRSCKGVPLQQV